MSPPSPGESKEIICLTAPSLRRREREEVCAGDADLMDVVERIRDECQDVSSFQMHVYLENALKETLLRIICKAAIY